MTCKDKASYGFSPPCTEMTLVMNMRLLFNECIVSYRSLLQVSFISLFSCMMNMRLLFNECIVSYRSLLQVSFICLFLCMMNMRLLFNECIVSYRSLLQVSFICLFSCMINMRLVFNECIVSDVSQHAERMCSCNPTNTMRHHARKETYKRDL